MNVSAFFLIAAMLLVGSNVGIGKSIIASIPVLVFALLRFVIALIVLWPCLRPAKMTCIKGSEWINLFLQAFFGTFLFTLLMLGGLKHTSAMAAGIITSAIPATVALFSWVLLGEKPNGRASAAIALAIAGVVAVNFAQDASPANAGDALGNLMIMGAVCCESLYVILSRRLTQTLAPIDICAYTHLFGLLLMLPLGLFAWQSFDYASVPNTVWALVVWYALSASVFSFWLWMKGIRHVHGSVAGVFTSAMPIAATAYGIVFLDERPTLVHGIALTCILAGIALASMKVKKSSGAPTLSKTQ